MEFKELQKIIRDESNKIRMPFTKFKISIVVDGITHIVPSERIHLQIVAWKYQPLPQMILVLSEEFGRKKIYLNGDYWEDDAYQPKLIMETESSAERWYVSKNGDWLEQWKATNGETIVTINGVDQSETFNQILDRLAMDDL